MKNIQIFSVCSHMYSWHVVHHWKDIQKKTRFHFSLDNRDSAPTMLLQFRSGAISSLIHPNIQVVILSLNSTFAIFLSIFFELLCSPRRCLRHRQNWNTSIEYTDMSIFCSRGRSTLRIHKKIRNSIASYSQRFSLKIERSLLGSYIHQQSLMVLSISTSSLPLTQLLLSTGPEGFCSLPQLHCRFRYLQMHFLTGYQACPTSWMGPSDLGYRFIFIPIHYSS